MKLTVGFLKPKRPCPRLWLKELARRSGSKLPGAELELADAQLASWANAALVGWFYKPRTKVNRRPPNEAWLRPNGFRFVVAAADRLVLWRGSGSESERGGVSEGG